MANTPLGLTLPISLGANGYFNTTTDPLEQIRSNLTNLLLTRKGERVFQPNFGSNLHFILFEPNTDDSVTRAIAEIQTAVSFWMPFLRIDNAEILSRDLDGHNITIKVSYTLLTNNITDSIILVF